MIVTTPAAEVDVNPARASTVAEILVAEAVTLFAPTAADVYVVPFKTNEIVSVVVPGAVVIVTVLLLEPKSSCYTRCIFKIKRCGVSGRRNINCLETRHIV